jgi:hypothetical protein
VNGVPKWRLAAGILVLALLGLFAAVLGPVYVRAFEFREFVSGLTHNADMRDRTDDALLRMVLAKSRSLNLPVAASSVQISRSGGEVHIDVRYMVRVDLPGYTAELHF